MKTLLISGFSGRMGQAAASFAPEYGFAPRDFEIEKAGDLLMDFSHPDCLADVLACPLPLVIGTTGYREEQTRAIRQAAESRPIFWAANFSPGIHMLKTLAELARGLLPDWQISLVETHHAKKRDAPGGTARMLAENLQITSVHSIRGGTVPGIHEIGFYGPEEHLTLTHTAESRAVFARGALKAAAWLMDKGPGLYCMSDLYK